jgi:hypothetical protein
VSSRAARRLQYAQEAVAHVKSVIRDAGNQREALEETGYNSLIRLRIARDDSFWDFSGLDRHKPDAITMNAAKASYIHGGNCGEHAEIAFTYLRAHAQGEVIRLSKVRGVDHTFVLIGDRGEPDDEVAVADGWPTDARACLWDDFHEHTSDQLKLRTTKLMVADGKDTVEYVRNRIRLRTAGRIVKNWDLDVLRRQGVPHIIELLEHYGYHLGREPIPRIRVVNALRTFAKNATGDKSKWSEGKLHLWCTSKVDPDVLLKIFSKGSASPEVISSGIDKAKEKGRMDWVWDQRITPAEDREYDYVY